MSCESRNRIGIKEAGGGGGGGVGGLPGLTLISACIFSTLFSLHFLWYW